jgi:hypothetical protein
MSRCAIQQENTYSTDLQIHERVPKMSGPRHARIVVHLHRAHLACDRDSGQRFEDVGTPTCQNSGPAAQGAPRRVTRDAFDCA